MWNREVHISWCILFKGAGVDVSHPLIRCKMIWGRWIASNRLFKSRYAMPTTVKELLKMKKIERPKGLEKMNIEFTTTSHDMDYMRRKQTNGFWKIGKAFSFNLASFCILLEHMRGFYMYNYRFHFVGINACSIAAQCLPLVYRLHPTFCWSNLITCQ